MKQTKYTTQVNVAMTEEEKTRLEEVANTNHKSMSEVARVGIEREVARLSKEKRHE